MRPERCAVLFDLDDTLYPRRRFVLSGFAAVAAYVERVRGIPARESFTTLARAIARTPGRELQTLAARFGLPAWLVPQLVEVIRAHTPRLRLPVESARVLEILRPHWRLGIVTNGPPDIQARKVAALGLAPLVDAVVYAEGVGRGVGKPDRAVFVEAARRVGVRPAFVVFVGDDPVADIAGARHAGMSAVHVQRGRERRAVPLGAMADAVVKRLDEAPSVAMGLIDGRRAYVG
jgi:putative hydrolase of the HAD superfamily